MRVDRWLTRRTIAGCLVLCLAAPYTKAAALGQNAAAAGRQENASDSGRGGPDADAVRPEAALPDAPEATQARSDDPGGQNPGGQSGSSQPNQDQQQNGAAKPVGTAAAPYEATTGVAASRPAGAAIAPAKQRRVRAILISVGVVVGAGIAIGTVAALSHSSPSQPK
jgi:hypothetical protein